MEWELIVGASGVFVAALAFGITVWHGIQSRKHNKLSVRPLLTSWQYTDNEEKQFKVGFTNCGIGPALIDNFVVRVDGEVISGVPSETVEKAVAIVFPDQSYSYEFGFVAKKAVVTVNEEVLLMNISFTDSSSPGSEEVFQCFNRIAIEVIYKSLYGIEGKLEIAPTKLDSE